MTQCALWPTNKIILRIRREVATPSPVSFVRISLWNCEALFFLLCERNLFLKTLTHPQCLALFFSFTPRTLFQNPHLHTSNFALTQRIRLIKYENATHTSFPSQRSLKTDEKFGETCWSLRQKRASEHTHNFHHRYHHPRRRSPATKDVKWIHQKKSIIMQACLWRGKWEIFGKQNYMFQRSLTR